MGKKYFAAAFHHALQWRMLCPSPFFREQCVAPSGNGLLMKNLVVRTIHAALLCALLHSGAAHAAIPVYGYRIVHAYPHRTDAFTEGLFYLDGFLYESTGLEGHSTIRKVNLDTGAVLQERDLSPEYFGEGIVNWEGRLIQLTWRSGTGFVYDLGTFAPKSTFQYPGEGWALTRDDHRLIMSDGTSELRFLDPTTLRETGRLRVTTEGRPVVNINELEWVKGQIYANIWETSLIARIDPASGKVVGWIDLSGLNPGAVAKDADAVLNGIAYDAAHDRLFVTGKDWPKLYEIALVPEARTR
jgi:glutaminyl-peptide cyclotransferase